MLFGLRARVVAGAVVVVAALWTGGAWGQGQPAIPDTPAGQTLRAWLDAFNSGDRAKVEQYVKTIQPTENVDGMLGFRSYTGGFQILSITKSEPLHISFVVKEKNSPGRGVGNLIVKPGNPPTVDLFAMQPLPAGVTPVDVSLDAGLRQRVLDGIAADLTRFYVDAGVAAKMVETLQSHQKAGDYNGVDDGDVFARRLTDDLQAVSHDRHLRVAFSPYKHPERHAPTPDEVAADHRQMLRDNCAFDKVELLPGNIGYVKFDAFMPPDVCKDTVADAMGFVAHTDALIFDLRENGGGDPHMVQLVVSYLFDKRTHINDLYTRETNKTEEFWTLDQVQGERMAKQPVYVLTAHRTFSGGEEFTYDLKTQKRATIVGETTGGGAHPVSGHVVAEYFEIGVPFATAINPITKTSWEGTGVEPDVKVPAADALTTAEKLAEEKLHGK